MPDIPAFCDSCGAAFPSGIFVDDVTDARMGRNECRCPVCGNIGYTSEFVMNAANGAITILSYNMQDQENIKRLVKILGEAKVKVTPPQELIAQLRGEPGWERIASYLSTLLLPKNSGEFYGLIAVLLTAIQLMQPKDDLTADQVSAIVNKAVETALVTQQRQSASSPARTPKTAYTHRMSGKKIGRNEPCPCGSTEKFKRCCGALSQRP